MNQRVKKFREAENEQKNDQDIANPQYFHLNWCHFQQPVPDI